MSVYADRGARASRRRAWVYHHLVRAGYTGGTRLACVTGSRRLARPYAAPAGLWFDILWRVR